jgi:2-C-methyl-D-erythritol 4-phosphate cytidylyltransferase
MNAALPKQYLCVESKTLLEHAIEVFVSHPKISEIVVCLHADDKRFDELAIAKHAKVTSVIGGASRAESVLQGLQYLKQYSKNQIVLVHDAARPGLTHMALNRLLACSGECNSAILALPVVDTIKQATKSIESLDKTAISERVVECTLDRARLYMAQTPQMFDIQELFTAINTGLHNAENITDEASAIELMGGKVRLIEGETCNLKVTRPEDLEIMRFYFAQRKTQ